VPHFKQAEVFVQQNVTENQLGSRFCAVSNGTSLVLE